MQPVFAVSGDKNSGKTTFLKNLITNLLTRGMDVQGFLALHDQEYDLYRLQNIRSQEKFRFMKRKFPPQPWPDHFEMYDEGIMAGNNSINHALIHRPDLFVIDEMGAFELNGRIWHDGFGRLIAAGIPLIFSTHTRHLAAINEKWNLTPTTIISLPDEIHAKRFSEFIVNTLNKQKTNDSDTKQD